MMNLVLLLFTGNAFEMGERWVRERLLVSQGHCNSVFVICELSLVDI